MFGTVNANKEYRQTVEVTSPVEHVSAKSVLVDPNPDERLQVESAYAKDGGLVLTAILLPGKASAEIIHGEIVLQLNDDDSTVLRIPYWGRNAL